MKIIKKIKKSLFIEISTCVLILILFSDVHSQNKNNDLKHWNLSVSGGITRYFSNNIFEPDTTKNDLNIDIDYLEYRIGYQFNQNHEINFSMRKISFWQHFVSNHSFSNGSYITEGDILKPILNLTIGYRFLLPQKNKNEYYFGIDLGGLPNMDNLLFNLQIGIKKLILDNLFFDASINYSSWISNLLFKKSYSRQIRLNLGLNLKF